MISQVSPQNTKPLRKLRISNLSPEVTMHNLELLLRECGPVKTLIFTCDSSTWVGTAHVKFREAGSVEKAYDLFHGVPLQGWPMFVTLGDEDIVMENQDFEYHGNPNMNSTFDHFEHASSESDVKHFGQEHPDHRQRTERPRHHKKQDPKSNVRTFIKMDAPLETYMGLCGSTASLRQSRETKKKPYSKESHYNPNSHSTYDQGRRQSDVQSRLGHVQQHRDRRQETERPRRGYYRHQQSIEERQRQGTFGQLDSDLDAYMARRKRVKN